MMNILQPSRGPAQPRQVDTLEALRIGTRFHQQGYLDAAQDHYRRILLLDARNASALHYLGVLLHGRGKSVEAIGYMQRSIVLDPEMPDWHVNLGDLYHRSIDMLPSDSIDVAAAARDKFKVWSGLTNKLVAARYETWRQVPDDPSM